MKRMIVIKVGDVTLPAELDDSPTADLVWEALPLKGKASVWGDEVYFEIPVAAEREPEARQAVEVGELGYWPVGRAFCIFFGPTPVSSDEQPRAYSPVNVFGRVLGDAAKLRGMQPGAPVEVIRAVVA